MALNIRKLDSEVANLEGMKKQVGMGNVREVRKYVFYRLGEAAVRGIDQAADVDALVAVIKMLRNNGNYGAADVLEAVLKTYKSERASRSKIPLLSKRAGPL